MKAIPGLNAGVVLDAVESIDSMVPGEKRTLTIPPGKAYGAYLVPLYSASH